ncbi:hypothetical protein TWF694_001698 [Orbilia ellipsospora]|uniref:Uncharacterized protein n=1 Tax=Orbilia ellipsospora TaxID=2528407 RepID=A0AAV9X3D2_9PEZI
MARRRYQEAKARALLESIEQKATKLPATKSQDAPLGVTKTISMDTRKQWIQNQAAKKEKIALLKSKIAAATTPPSSRKRKSEDDHNSVEQTRLHPRKKLPIIEGMLTKIAADQGQKPLRALRAKSLAPCTPANKIISEPEPESLTGYLDRMVPSSEVDEVIKKIVEEKIALDPNYKDIDERSKNLVRIIKQATEMKKRKLDNFLKQKGKKLGELERWDSFSRRLRRNSLPRDKHLRGPLIRPEYRATSPAFKKEDIASADPDVHEIMHRWDKSAVVEDLVGGAPSPVTTTRYVQKLATSMEQEGVTEDDSDIEDGIVPLAKAEKVKVQAKKEGPGKPRYNLRSEAERKPAGAVKNPEKPKKEKAKGPLVRKFKDTLSSYKAEKIQRMEKVCKLKKRRAEEAQAACLESAANIKNECEALKSRCDPPLVGLAKRAIHREVERLTALHQTTMEKYARAQASITQIDAELLELRQLLAELPDGDERPLEEVKENVGAVSKEAAQQLTKLCTETLRKQQKRERRALRALRGH